MSTQVIEKTTTYLTFTLGEEVFSVDVSKVREVLEYTKITKVPKVPEFMRGVINLRGTVVPVIDLKLKFGMGVTKDTIDTVIVVMEVALNEAKELTVLGMLTDSVQEVIDMEPDSIEPAPHVGASVNTDFIKGMGKRNGNFIIILNIDKVFEGKELEVVKTASARSRLNISQTEEAEEEE